MRSQAVRARPRRRGVPKGEGVRLTSVIAPNVIDRQFTATRPNQRWIADCTCVWTAEGWPYVAAVIDLISRRVVGWSMSRSGDVWDNAAIENFFSSLKAERIRGKVDRTRDDARADVFDYTERFCNAVRRHSTIGYISPAEFGRKVGLA